MSAPLVEKIAAQLHVAEDEVQSLLSAFVAAMREEVDASGRANLPGVGSFQRNGAGLVFEADQDLINSVNVRFQGLEPIRVAAPAETPADEQQSDVIAPPASAPDVLAVEEDVVSAKGPTTDEIVRDDEEDREVDDVIPTAPPEEEGDVDLVPADEGPPPPVAEEPVQHATTNPDYEEEEDRPTDTPAFIPRRSHEFDETEAEASAELDPRSDYDEQEPEFVTTPSDTPEAIVVPDDDEAQVVPPVNRDVPPRDLAGEGSSEVTATPEREPEARTDRAPRRSSAPWIMVGVVLLLVGAAGIFLYLSGQPASETPPTAEQPPPTASDATDVETEEEVLGDATGEFDSDLAQSDVDEAAPPASASPLYGESIDRSISQYTLVVASLPSEAAANEEAENWRGRGIRTDVFSESTVAGTRYRVAIGQFETIERADSVRSQSDIASDLPEGTWVYRYPASPIN